MASKSKAKGNRFERDFVAWLKERGYEARRAWGSNGQALGWDESVDVEVMWSSTENLQHANYTHCQLKSRAKLPQYLQIPDACSHVVFKQDRGPTLVLMRAEDVWPELPDPGPGA